MIGKIILYAILALILLSILGWVIDWFLGKFPLVGKRLAILDAELDGTYTTVLGAIHRAKKTHGKLSQCPKDQSSFGEISFEMAILWEMETGIGKKVQRMSGLVFKAHDLVLLEKFYKIHQALSELDEKEIKITADVSKKFKSMEKYDGKGLEEAIRRYKGAKFSHNMCMILLEQEIRNVLQARARTWAYGDGI